MILNSRFLVILFFLLRQVNTEFLFSQTDNYNNEKIIEKVYLHVDRDAYFPGDDIWFKAYLVEASGGLLSDHSYNLHVELISPASKIIDSRVVRIDGGLGKGDFHLPDTLKSGRYRIRAYSNYMRNFSDQLFFNKEIAIINSSDADKTFSGEARTVADRISASFFPEGGSLVDDVFSVVAFKAENSVGTACDVEGELFSSSGELITSFKSTHKGMGTFAIKPVPGTEYYAVIKNRNGDEIKSEIPGSFTTGVIFNISKNLPGELEILVRTNKETLPMILDQDLSLTVSARGIAYNTISFRMKSINSFLVLPTVDLPDGIFMLTLSGPDNKPMCERLVYIQNNKNIGINITTDKKVYKQRDSVLVKISLQDSAGIAPEAFLSLSSFEDISEKVTIPYPANISSWFLLESDVRGPVEEPSYYFDQSNPGRFKDLDLLLLTQGWRDFEWKYKTTKYEPEYGFTISGRIRKKFAKVPVKNASVTIGIFKAGMNPRLDTISADSSGRFSLDAINLTGKAKLIASVTDKNDKLKGSLLLDSVKYSPAMISNERVQTEYIKNNGQTLNTGQLLNEVLLTRENLRTYIQSAEIKSSVQRKYKLSDTIAPGEVKIVARRQDAPESARARSRRYLMGTPDKEIVVTPELEAYTNVGQFVDQRLLSPVRLVLAFAGDLNPNMEHPLYMIDGVKVPKDAVNGIPMKWVERIDVLDVFANYMSFGNLGPGADTTGGPIDGVISIIMRNDYPLDYSPVTHSVNISFSGYDEPRIFYSPEHHSTLQSDFKPDLRTTLFWEPDIEVRNNKDFYLDYFNSDNSSKVKVIVEGITSTGIPVTGKTEYEVK